MKRLLITREKENSVSYENLISQKGGIPFVLPMIKTLPLTAEFKKKSYDIGILTSPNAVKYFIAYKDYINVKKWYAVGEHTAEVMHKYLNITEDIIYPSCYYMQDLLKLFEGQALDNKYIINPGAKIRAYDSKSYFERKGAIYEEPYTYQTIKEIYPKGFIDNYIVSNQITGVLFFSPSAVYSFASQTDNIPECLNFYAIGATTRKAALNEGINAEMSDIQNVTSMIEMVMR